MKLGVSACAFPQTLLNNATSISQLQDAYLEQISETVNLAKSLGLNLIELGAFPPYNAEILFPIEREIQKLIAGLDVSYHLPAWEINIGALNNKIRNVVVDEVIKHLQLCQNLDIKNACLHPGAYGAMLGFYAGFEGLVRKQVETSCSEVFKAASKYDIKISIENLSYNTPFYSESDEFMPLIELGYNFLLDTSHAITSGHDPLEFINKLGRYIREVHLVDGLKNQPDKHLVLGEGEVDFLQVFEALSQIGFEGPYIFELISADDVRRSFNYLSKKNLI